MNHKAIYALYPNVVSIDDTHGAFDANGNQVTIDESAINAWVDPNAYKQQRKAEYPAIYCYFINGDFISIFVKCTSSVIYGHYIWVECIYCFMSIHYPAISITVIDDTTLAKAKEFVSLDVLFTNTVFGVPPLFI